MQCCKIARYAADHINPDQRNQEYAIALRCGRSRVTCSAACSQVLLNGSRSTDELSFHSLAGRGVFFLAEISHSLPPPSANIFFLSLSYYLPLRAHAFFIPLRACTLHHILCIDKMRSADALLAPKRNATRPAV